MKKQTKDVCLTERALFKCKCERCELNKKEFIRMCYQRVITDLTIDIMKKSINDINEKEQ